MASFPTAIFVVGWLGGWFGGWLVGWLGGWVVGWLGGWMVGWLGCWLVGLIMSFFMTGDFVIATQRAFRAQFVPSQNDAILDRIFKLL